MDRCRPIRITTIVILAIPSACYFMRWVPGRVSAILFALNRRDRDFATPSWRGTRE